jgi:hypothetical protein
MPALSPDQIEIYGRDGLVAPIDVFSAEEIRAYGESFAALRRARAARSRGAPTRGATFCSPG